MIPTRRLVLLAALPLALGAAAMWVPVLAWPMAAIDAVILLIAAVDLALSGCSFEASRSVKPVQAVGRWFDVELRLRSTGWRDVTLKVTDDARGETEGLPLGAVLGKNTEVSWVYKLRIGRRGEHVFGPVVVRWGSPLGLVERQRVIAVSTAVRVYPDFAQLRRNGLRGPSDQRRIPVRVRRKPGGDSEFERNRPYVRGDPMRHIDWRATARKGQFITREYGQESNQNVIFLIDCGRMMSAQSGELSAFDHALNAALIMGQAALRHGDRVGLLAFDSRIRTWLPPKGGARSGSRLIRATYDLFPSMEEPDYALAFRYLSKHVRRRSLIVLLTSVVDSVNAEKANAIVGAMAGRHLPISVWIRDPEVDKVLADPVERVGEQYTRAAAAELALEREKSLAALRKRSALVIDCAASELTSELLGKYVEIKARRLL